MHWGELSVPSCISNNGLVLCATSTTCLSYTDADCFESAWSKFFSVKVSFFVPVLCLVKHPGTKSFCQHKCACAALLCETHVCCGLLDCCVGVQSWAVIGEVYQLQDVDFNHLNASFPQKSMLAQADHSSVVFG